MLGGNVDSCSAKKKSLVNENVDTAKKTTSQWDKRIRNDNLDIKAYPKFDIYVQPSSSDNKCNKNRVIKKDRFAHVLSPIGTYMKKTAVTPLIMDMKQRQCNELPNLYRKLDLGSPTETQKNDDASALSCKVMEQKILPKKMYTSSALLLVKKERSPTIIPGGKKIHKYLDSATAPSVWKHKGVYKMIDVSNGHCRKCSQSPTIKI